MKQINHYANMSNAQLLAAFKQIVEELNVRDLEAAYNASIILKEEIVKKKEVEELIEKGKKDALITIQERREQERQEAIKKSWQNKKNLSLKLKALLKEGGEYYINVWEGSDKRVYINDGQPFGKHTKEVACFFAVGNSRKAPGHLELTKSYLLEGKEEEFKAILKEMATLFNSTKFSVQEAINYNA